MARKGQLREQRAGTVINSTSKNQESEVIQALHRVVVHIKKKFGANIDLEHTPNWHLKEGLNYPASRPCQPANVTSRLS